MCIDEIQLSFHLLPPLLLLLSGQFRYGCTLLIYKLQYRVYIVISQLTGKLYIYSQK